MTRGVNKVRCYLLQRPRHRKSHRSGVRCVEPDPSRGDRRMLSRCGACPRLLFAGAVAAMFLVQPLAAEVQYKMKEVAGTKLYYRVVLPNGYDPAKTYPAILAFPGGPQTMDTVE